MKKTTDCNIVFNFFLLERRLMSSEQLFSEHSRPYFNPGLLDRAYMVEDDHIPFLQRGE